MKHRNAWLAATWTILSLSSAPCPASPNTFFFEVSNAISPEQPSTTVTIWAAFDKHWMAFGDANTSVATTLDPGWLSEPTPLLDPLKLSRQGDVAPDGDIVSGIYIMQLYIPFSLYPDESNPIALWSATWTTDDFSPRVVRLDTLSESFNIYRDDGELLELFGTDFSEGSGLIQVVPAPSATVVLASAWAAVWRRRRNQAT